MTSKSLILVARPRGFPTEDIFKIETHPIPQPSDGELLAKTLFISVDPYLRGRFSERLSYAPSYELGKVIVGFIVAEVVESKNEKFPVGSVITTVGPFSEYFVTTGKDWRIVDPKIPASLHVGALGMPGLTAYFGLLDIATPKAGETIVVSGAAGAVGSLVGQIAKNLGLRTIGIAGSDEKVKYLVEKLGFDVALNYKTTPDLHAAIKEVAPTGVDIYFDNVGGEISDAVYKNLKTFGRVSICGQIATYNDQEASLGPRFGRLILGNRLKVQGFIISDFTPRFGEAFQALITWYKEGKLIADETILEGIEKIPEAFIGLFTGANIGKMVIKISEYQHK